MTKKTTTRMHEYAKFTLYASWTIQGHAFRLANSSFEGSSILLMLTRRGSTAPHEKSNESKTENNH